MGLFKRLFSRKKIEEPKEINIDETVNEDLKEIEYEPLSVDDIEKNKRLLKETKVEYQAVTSYLSDIQRMDLIPSDEKDVIEDAAKNIIALKLERDKYHKRNPKLTDAQYKILEQYEERMPNEIKKLKEAEQYGALIKNDMRHLEGEKGVIRYEQEEVIHQQNYLKKIGITTFLVVIGLFFIFLLLDIYTEIEMGLPYMITLFMATVSGSYMFIQGRKNTLTMKNADIKMKKVVSLLNSVKIKYVNNTSTIDYCYSKYMVNSALLLEYIWGEYMKAKDAAKKYEKNTELLNYYNERLIRELVNFQVKDSEIWIYQPEAILDNKEMVEIRHRLNVRRQKLRTQIERLQQLIEGVATN